MADWPTLALYWYAPAGAPSPTLDPIFGRPLTFYLFTLPAWQLIAGWLMTLAVIVGVDRRRSSSRSPAAARILGGRRDARRRAVARRCRSRSPALLLMLAARVYLGRFERLFDDHTIFAGVTYTDAHVTLTGMLVVACALAARRRHRARQRRVGAARALARRRGRAGRRLLRRSSASLGWYVSSFIVKPNELVREQPYIAHNIEMTRQAYALDRDRAAPVPRRQRRRGGRRREQPGRRCRTSACGTGARCRTRCARSRRSAPTTTSPTSTSIATRSTARCAR